MGKKNGKDGVWYFEFKGTVQINQFDFDEKLTEKSARKIAEAALVNADHDLNKQSNNCGWWLEKLDA